VLSRRLTARLDAPAVAAWTLAFTLVAYLALRGGGYDTVVRSEVGVAIWWIVLLAALAGILPARIGRAGWLAIGLLAAFATWTGLAVGWSESAERSAVELGRVAAYLGVLVLAVSLQGRTAARHTVNGLACAIGLVSVLAVLSRLHPQAFPPKDHFDFLGPASARKLSYPLNYWNGLAAFAAIGVPLLLAVAVAARTLAGQAAAAATLPVSVLCVSMTISRGGVLALAVGLLAFLVLVPRRLDALATLVVSGAGAAILLVANAQRDALGSGAPTPAAIAEGTEVLVLALIVCGGVALVQVAIGLAARYLERPAALAPSSRQLALGALALVAVTAAVATAAGAPGELERRWQDFKAPPGVVAPGRGGHRLQPAAGGQRQRPLRVLASGGGRRRDRSAQGHRARDVRALVVAQRDRARLRARRAHALLRDAGRDRDRRARAARRAAADARSGPPSCARCARRGSCACGSPPPPAASRRS
jgi:hypothetical protein